MQNCACYTSIYLLRRPDSIVVVGFHCDIIGCELAQRGVLRGAAEANSIGKI